MNTNRARVNWEQTTKEPVKVECIGGTLYAFGSELAILRLFVSYHGNAKARMGYSTNLKTWFFSLDM